MTMISLDYATRATLFRPDLRHLALYVLTENLRPPNPIAIYLVAKIMTAYLQIEAHGPNALDLHLRQEAERRRLRRDLRASMSRL